MPLETHPVCRLTLLFKTSRLTSIAEEESLRECLPYLHIAEKDYCTLEIYNSLLDVQYLLSVVYHNLGMIKERDEAAVRHNKADEERKIVEVIVVEPWVGEVWELVAAVGVALATR